MKRYSEDTAVLSKHRRAEVLALQESFDHHRRWIERGKAGSTLLALRKDPTILSSVMNW